jgi:hypothetical protein
MYSEESSFDRGRPPEMGAVTLHIAKLPFSSRQGSRRMHFRFIRVNGAS